MNKNQKIALFVTAGVLLVMLVFPPFAAETPSGVVHNFGYHFIAAPPITRATVHVSVLLVQVFAAGVAGAVLCFALSGDGREAERDRLS